MMVWADDDSLQVINHTNFLLNNSGEKIILSVNTTILDSIAFGPQGANISIARCPDGIGAFAPTSVPTYNKNNCSVGIKEINSESVSFNVFPNPANQLLIVTCSENKIIPIEILNMMGEIIFKDYLNQKTEINTSTLSQGIYIIKVLNKTIKVVVNH